MDNQKRALSAPVLLTIFKFEDCDDGGFCNKPFTFMPIKSTTVSEITKRKGSVKLPCVHFFGLPFLIFAVYEKLK